MKEISISIENKDGGKTCGIRVVLSYKDGHFKAASSNLKTASKEVVKLLKEHKEEITSRFNLAVAEIEETCSYIENDVICLEGNNKPPRGGGRGGRGRKDDDD